MKPRQQSRAKQSKAREGFRRCRAAAAAQSTEEPHTGRWGRGACHGSRGPHAHTPTHSYTWKPAQCERVVCAQRLFPSCIWEVNTRVWAQSPGQPLQLAKELPCFLEFGVICLCSENTKPKRKTKQKAEARSGQPTLRFPSRGWGAGIGYGGFDTVPQ